MTLSLHIVRQSFNACPGGRECKKINTSKLKLTLSQSTICMHFSSVPIGILFLLYSLVRAGKNFCSRRAQRLLLAEKREQIKANIKAFEEKYPQVTSAQQAIVDLDFADLLTQLQVCQGQRYPQYM